MFVKTPLPVHAPALPRILVFSEGCMSASHGTGAIFLRNFHAYPPGLLCNAFIGSGENNGVANAIDLNAARWPRGLAGQLRALPRRLANRVPGVSWRPLPLSRAAVGRALAATAFQPDLVYAICWGAEGLATLVAVMNAYPGVPLVLHLHDFWPSSTPAFPALLRELAPRTTAIWTISRALGAYVEKTTGRATEVESPFHITVPPPRVLPHRSDAAQFRTIVIGNFWNDALLDDVKNLWRACRRQLPMLPPIAWHCHSDGVAQLRARGRTPEPELQPAGFLRGEDLWNALAGADLALVPFSRGAEPASDYERYSIPSRLTELVAAGLPLFALTGPATPLADYLAEKRIGVSCPAAETERAATELCALILDPARRRELGERARAVAEDEFPLGPYQQSLYARLAQLACGRS